MVDRYGCILRIVRSWGFLRPLRDVADHRLLAWMFSPLEKSLCLWPHLGPNLEPRRIHQSPSWPAKNGQCDDRKAKGPPGSLTTKQTRHRHPAKHNSLVSSICYLKCLQQLIVAVCKFVPSGQQLQNALWFIHWCSNGGCKEVSETAAPAVDMGASVCELGIPFTFVTLWNPWFLHKTHVSQRVLLPLMDRWLFSTKPPST